MAFTWVRPTDSEPLSRRPLLDLGCGDGQTLAALVEPTGLVVGTDHRLEVVRLAKAAAGTPVVAADATELPFSDAAFRCVLAADLFHHFPDEALERVLEETRRVLAQRGSLIAWWYESAGRPAPDAPRYPRPYRAVAETASAAGLRPAPLDLTVVLEGGPPTVGLFVSG